MYQLSTSAQAYKKSLAWNITLPSHRVLDRKIYCLVQENFSHCRLNIYSFVLFKLIYSWPSRTPLAFCISVPIGENLEFFHCIMKWGVWSCIAHIDCKVNPLVMERLTHCKAQDLVHCLSAFAVSKHCTTWAWCVNGLFSMTLNHALIFSLTSAYPSFNLDHTAWSPNE